MGNKLCHFCKKLLTGREKKYCTIQCQADETKEKIILLIESGKYNSINKKPLYRYLIETRGRKCETCKNDHWLGRLIYLEVEHKDGNSNNNKLTNVCLICPNCHSLTPTYKNKNKGNGRHWRMERYKKGLSY